MLISNPPSINGFICKFSILPCAYNESPLNCLSVVSIIDVFLLCQSFGCLRRDNADSSLFELHIGLFSSFSLKELLWSFSLKELLCYDDDLLLD